VRAVNASIYIAQSDETDYRFTSLDSKYRWYFHLALELHKLLFFIYSIILLTFPKPGYNMNNNLNLNSVVVASKNQVFANVEGETVLLNTDTGIYFGLNPLGTRIWSLIQEPATASQIRDTIFEEYDVELVRCQDDIINLLAKLKDAGLIDVIEEEIS
jgi:hypothetical protein